MRRPTAKSIVIQLDMGAIAGENQNQFLQRSNTLKAPQRAESIEILNIIEFTSSRKRMSVIIREPDGRIKVLTKGADSVLSELLSQIDLHTPEGKE